MRRQSDFSPFHPRRTIVPLLVKFIDEVARLVGLATLVFGSVYAVQQLWLGLAEGKAGIGSGALTVMVGVAVVVFCAACLLSVISVVGRFVPPSRRGGVITRMLVTMATASYALSFCARDTAQWHWLTNAWQACAVLLAILLTSRFVWGIRAYVIMGKRARVALIGSPDVTRRLMSALYPDISVVSVINQRPAAAADAFTALRQLALRGDIGTVIVATWEGETGVCHEVMRQLAVLPIDVAVPAGRKDFDVSRSSLRLIGHVPLKIVCRAPLSVAEPFEKLLLDKIGAILIFLLASPLMALSASAIFMETGYPIFFRQERTGLFGQSFCILKFRTMRVEDGGPGGQTQRRDPRCTKVGAILRRLSIDELPQLWNVLRGDMSLVGPRPHAEALHTLQTERLSETYLLRQRVRPGLTGWAQIHGARGGVQNTEQLRRRVQYDLEYIDNWSIWLDLWILVRTPFCVLRGENAY